MTLLASVAIAYAMDWQTLTNEWLLLGLGRDDVPWRHTGMRLIVVCAILLIVHADRCRRIHRLFYSLLYPRFFCRVARFYRAGGAKPGRVLALSASSLMLVSRGIITR
ncbi:MAG: hypothetical protein AAFO81_13340 [Pseudomonadota bacterium]